MIEERIQSPRRDRDGSEKELRKEVRLTDPGLIKTIARVVAGCSSALEFAN
jgi:hypothetical protein